MFKVYPRKIHVYIEREYPPGFVVRKAPAGDCAR